MYTATSAFKNKPIAAAPAPGGAFLIDDVGVDAIAALGFYKLRAAYTGDCIQVRRTSDSTVLDIGFDGSGLVDTAAIATFCAGTEGRISIWYDQSGNGFDFTVTQTPQAGIASQQPIIYYSGAVTTDAAGNVAAYSREPGSTSALGLYFLNSPTMTARVRPTITFFAQVNTFNGNGLFHTELDNGYNIGTYGASVPNNTLRIIRSNGTNLITKGTVQTNDNPPTDPFAATVWYNDDGTGKFWLTSYLDNVATFETTFSVDGLNASTYNNCTIFRYYSPSLYQNCTMSGYIYWDIADDSTLSATELYDLYDWVETNLGYTNNAPT
jgi:hypothetical protein